MRTFLAILSTGLAGAALWAQAQPAAKPQKSPYEVERDRIERELEGVWSVTDFKKPVFRTVARVSGFMLAQRGWLSINVVVTSKDSTYNENLHFFVGSMKNYKVTETNRLRLTDVWGFSNSNKGQLTPDVSGTVEERDLLFTGGPDVGQRLRIQRAPDDFMEFTRRSAPPPPPAAPAPTDR